MKTWSHLVQHQKTSPSGWVLIQGMDKESCSYRHNLVLLYTHTWAFDIISFRMLKLKFQWTTSFFIVLNHIWRDRQRTVQNKKNDMVERYQPITTLNVAQYPILLHWIRTRQSYGLYLNSNSQVTRDPFVELKFRNFSGLLRASQFSLYREDEEVLSLQTPQQFCFLLSWQHVKVPGPGCSKADKR